MPRREGGRGPEPVYGETRLSGVQIERARQEQGASVLWILLQRFECKLMGGSPVACLVGRQSGREGCGSISVIQRRRSGSGLEVQRRFVVAFRLVPYPGNDHH